VGLGSVLADRGDHDLPRDQRVHYRPHGGVAQRTAQLAVPADQASNGIDRGFKPGVRGIGRQLAPDGMFCRERDG
jgi:hypothetical protein